MNEELLYKSYADAMGRHLNSIPSKGVERYAPRTIPAEAMEAAAQDYNNFIVGDFKIPKPRAYGDEALGKVADYGQPYVQKWVDTENRRLDEMRNQEIRAHQAWLAAVKDYFGFNR